MKPIDNLTATISKTAADCALMLLQDHDTALVKPLMEVLIQARQITWTTDEAHADMAIMQLEKILTAALAPHKPCPDCADVGGVEP